MTKYELLCEFLRFCKYFSDSVSRYKCKINDNKCII